MRSFKKTVKRARFSPLDVILLIAVTAFLYTLMEWLFIISKPSFINTTSFSGKLFVLLNSSAVLTILCVLLTLPFMLLYLIRSKPVRMVTRFLMCAMPALIAACTILLLVDNTTYTLTSFGIVSTKGVTRALYLAGFLLITLLLDWFFFVSAASLERSRRSESSKGKLLFSISFGLVILICAAFSIVLNPNLENPLFKTGSTVKTEKLPNILLITGDGINAEKLSMYGALKDTTPFLSKLAETSLVTENAFSNAQGTIGSTTSILTGKYPADLGVLASIDILKGADAYQHLPGILKAYGYKTVQLNFSYYADAYRVNFQNAFDEANGQSPVENKIQSTLARLFPTDYYYFIREMYTRITDRLGHIFYRKDMSNPFLQVTEAPKKFNDQEKLEYLLELLEQSDQPLFVHLHWMGTHGPKFYPEQQVFSIDKSMLDQKKYDNDFYLDSILEFDSALARLYEKMESDDLVDQTVLVVGSDHTLRWSVSRIPLLMHFPEDDHAGLISENVQNLDIAPTLLDYLKIPQPEWMSGQSLLSPLDADRPIFLAAIPDSSRDPETNKVIYPEPKAPYYQFGKMTVIVCNHYYLLNFYKGTLTDASVRDYMGTCANPAPDRDEAMSLILAHLQQYGFDTSQLEEIVP